MCTSDTPSPIADGCVCRWASVTAHVATGDADRAVTRALVQAHAAGDLAAADDLILDTLDVAGQIAGLNRAWHLAQGLAQLRAEVIGERNRRTYNPTHRTTTGTGQRWTR
jgi:hypothetical protein